MTKINSKIAEWCANKGYVTCIDDADENLINAVFVNGEDMGLLNSLEKDNITVGEFMQKIGFCTLRHHMKNYFGKDYTKSFFDVKQVDDGDFQKVFVRLKQDPYYDYEEMERYRLYAKLYFYLLDNKIRVGENKRKVKVISGIKVSILKELTGIN